MAHRASILSWGAALLCGLTPILAQTTAPATAARGDTVLAVLRDFEAEAPGDKGAAINHWRWSDAEKARAPEFSRLQIVGETPFGARCARITVSDQLPWGGRLDPLSIPRRPRLPSA